ncbi:MAG TPA: Spx/MgsR family RNA polymerase-binding regulatory protein [Verrucomicrobiaceae bacterium]
MSHSSWCANAEGDGLEFPWAQYAAATTTDPMLKVYVYQGCSTCRNAMKWLRGRKITFHEVAIRETPPAIPELKSMLKSRGELTKLFNTSGMDYRALGLKDKLLAMSESDALSLLSANGNLVKRPFVIDEKAGVFLTGFKEPEWKEALAKEAT